MVITLAMMTVGRSMGMIPDYSKGKAAAIRIMRLNKRVSQINPHDESGIILVCIYFESILFLRTINLYLMFRKMLSAILNFVISVFDIQVDLLFVFLKIFH